MRSPAEHREATELLARIKALPDEAERERWTGVWSRAYGSESNAFPALAEQHRNSMRFAPVLQMRGDQK